MISRWFWSVLFLGALSSCLPGVGSMVYYTMILVSTAYLTVVERKILAGSQRRKGPNKNVWKGVAQPLADALKLLTKQSLIPLRSNGVAFSLAPVLALTLSSSLWLVLPDDGPSVPQQFAALLFLCLSCFHVYAVVLAGWSSNSMYAMMGGLRAIAQTISYELPLTMIFLIFCYFLGDYSLEEGVMWGKIFPLFLLNLPLAVMWYILSVVELHRAPFDLTEAESELVSGYNTDYSSGGFIMLFVSEYMNILFMGQISAFMWLGGGNPYWSAMAGCLLSFSVLQLRAAYPRLRYDKLMTICWVHFLPIICLSYSTAVVVGGGSWLHFGVSPEWSMVIWE